MMANKRFAQKPTKKELAIMKANKLTKKELAIVRKILAYQPKGHLPYHCFMNAQQATMYGHALGVELLYHEGFFDRRGSKMPHAWNSLNGKLVDLSGGPEKSYRFAKHYESVASYTYIEVLKAQIGHAHSEWIKNPSPNYVDPLTWKAIAAAKDWKKQLLPASETHERETAAPCQPRQS
jgi:hypothetical protein